MTWYTFGPVPVYDARPGATNKIVVNGTGGKAVLTKDGAALDILDMNGTPITEITSNQDGMSIVFQAQTLYCLVQFGDIVNPAWAVEVAAMLANQDQVLQAAQDAVTAAQAAVAAAQAGGGGTATGLDTEAVQDVIGAMVAQAGGAYNDAAGTISLPAPSVTGAVINDTTASGSSVYSSNKVVTLLTGYAQLSSGKVPIAQIPVGTIATIAPGVPQYVPYATAFAAANRAVIMGTRTDCPVIVTGQRVVIANGVVTAQDPPVPWLVNQDQSIVTPVTSLT